MEVVMLILLFLIGIPIIAVFFNKARATVDSDFKERMDQANKINNMFPHMDTDVVIDYAKNQDLELQREQKLRQTVQKIKENVPDLDEEALLKDIKSVQEQELQEENRKKRDLEELRRKFPEMDLELLRRHADTLEFIAEEKRKLSAAIPGF